MARMGGMKPPFAYYGGKGRLADWIVSLMPPHRVYVEPFAGSAAVLLAKRPVPHEVLNDLDGNLVNFFEVLRERPEDLLRVCGLTPYARDEFATAKPDEPGIDALERARRYWVRVNQSFNKSAMANNGWATSIAAGTSPARSVANRLERFHAVAERLLPVTIENRPALDVIAAYGADDGVMYVDPPYFEDTRTAGGYVHDMGHEEGHRALASALHETSSTVILSGYPSPLYDDDLYAGWHRIERAHLRRSSNWEGGARAQVTEVVWCNRTLAVPDAGLFELGAVNG